VVTIVPKQAKTAHRAQLEEKTKNRMKIINTISGTMQGLTFGELVALVRLSEKVVASHLFEMKRDGEVRKVLDESDGKVRYVTTPRADRYLRRRLEVFALSLEELVDIIVQTHRRLAKTPELVGDAASWSHGWKGYYVGVLSRKEERLIVIRSTTKREMNDVLAVIDRRLKSDMMHYYEPGMKELYIRYLKQ